MVPDPRWLELLKASGWQTAAVAAALGLFLYSHYLEWIPPLESWVVQSVVFGLLIFGMLAIASCVSNLYRIFPLHNWLSSTLAVQRKKKKVEQHIPHLTPKEREIIGYLLAHNQKIFQCDSAGGYAATLIAQGIVQRALRHGDWFDLNAMTFKIPNYVWEVLERHREEFPYEPSKNEGAEPLPWYIP